MNIYLCTQWVNRGWDTYNSFVCVAKSEDEARCIHPDGRLEPEEWVDIALDKNFPSWCYSPDEVDVTLIGEASESEDKSVILASFHAG